MQERHNYDYLLFDNQTDLQLSKLYGVTRQCISVQRKKYASHTNSLEILFKQNAKLIDDKILEYIKINPFDINVSSFKKLYFRTLQKSSNRKAGRIHKITQSRFRNIAEENKIEISFNRNRYVYNEHGLHCFKKNNCNCDIGKLASFINSKFRKLKNKKCQKLTCNMVNYFANRYIFDFLEIILSNKIDIEKNLMRFYLKIFDEIEEFLVKTPNQVEFIFKSFLENKKFMRNDNYLSSEFNNLLSF